MKKNANRLLILFLASGIWVHALIQLQGQSAEASARGLTRHELSAALRDVMREYQPVNQSQMRAALSEILNRCRVTGRLTEGEVNVDDITDFTARLQC